MTRRGSLNMPLPRPALHLTRSGPRLVLPDRSTSTRLRLTPLAAKQVLDLNKVLAKKKVEFNGRE
jgi:hypothetical protein